MACIVSSNRREIRVSAKEGKRRRVFKMEQVEVAADSERGLNKVEHYIKVFGLNNLES